MINVKSKAGMSLVEMVVAVALLAILVVAAVTALNLSQSTIQKTNAAEKSASLAQGTTDTLMSAVSGCNFKAEEDEIIAACKAAANTAEYVSGDFTLSGNGVQFTVKATGNSISSGGSNSTNVFTITVRASYNGSTSTYSATSYPIGGLQDGTA